MPMLLARRARHHIAGPDHLDRPTPALNQTEARSHNKRLPEWVRVPVAARARLERDVGTARARGCWRFEQWIDPNRASEILRRPLDGGLRTASFEFHLENLSCFDRV